MPRNDPSARSKPNSRTGLTRLVSALLACALLAAVVGVAATSSPTEAATGGAVYVPKPKLKRVKCVKSCASKRRPRAGQSELRISGRRMSRVRTVTFHGGRGLSDNVSAKVRRRTSRAVRVAVPFRAETGPVSARVSRRVRSKMTRRLRILEAPAPLANAKLSLARGPRDRGAPRIETATSKTRFFYGSRFGVGFAYRLQGSAPANVRVAVVRARDGEPVRSWAPQKVSPGNVVTVGWRGTRAGRVMRSGRYLYRVVADTAGRTARNAATHDVRRDAFNLYGHFFPIRARHDYGGAAARFGAGRGGRSHRGHDVFARCGSKLVAARAGKVKYSGYQGAAGNYIVIDGARTKLDYVYMHLARRSPFRTGDRVRTGQKIGLVGETGNAQGCHLHFEIWRGGWYSGGRPINPLPHLKGWDKVS